MILALTRVLVCVLDDSLWIQLPAQTWESSISCPKVLGPCSRREAKSKHSSPRFLNFVPIALKLSSRNTWQILERHRHQLNRSNCVCAIFFSYTILEGNFSSNFLSFHMKKQIHNVSSNISNTMLIRRRQTA